MRPTDQCARRSQAIVPCTYFSFSLLCNVHKNIFLQKGVSLLLHESLEISGGNASIVMTELAVEDRHVCITATVHKRVGSFFQNNDSVLVPLTSYARDAI